MLLKKENCFFFYYYFSCFYVEPEILMACYFSTALRKLIICNQFIKHNAHLNTYIYYIQYICIAYIYKYIFPLLSPLWQQRLHFHMFGHKRSHKHPHICLRTHMNQLALSVSQIFFIYLSLLLVFCISCAVCVYK